MSKIKAFRDQVFIRPVDEKFDSCILMPQRRNQSFQLGYVVKASEKGAEVVNEGDLVLFQVMLNQAGIPMSHAYPSEEHGILMIQHYKDLLGRLVSKKPVLTRNDFEPIGQWLLLEHTIKGKIDVTRDNGEVVTLEIPSTAQAYQNGGRFKVLRQGNQVGLGLTIGQEVIVNRTRANPIGFPDQSLLYYVDEPNILGAIEPDMITETA